MKTTPTPTRLTTTPDPYAQAPAYDLMTPPPPFYIVEVYNDDNGNTARARFSTYSEALSYCKKCEEVYSLQANIL